MIKQAKVVYNSDNKDWSADFFKTISSNRFAIITNLPEKVNTDVSSVFAVYDDKYDKHESKQKAGRGVKGRGGCLWGHRKFYTTSELNEKINDKANEKYKSFLQIHAFTEALLEGFIQQLNRTFETSIPETSLSSFFNSKVGAARYFPVTKQRIQQAFEQKWLNVSDPNLKNIIAFIEHWDTESFTFLFYRGNRTSGLRIKRNDSWENLTLEDLELNEGEYAILVFTGLEVEFLTHGHLTSLEHFVEITPTQQASECMLSPNEVRATLGVWWSWNSKHLAPIIADKKLTEDSAFGTILKDIVACNDDGKLAEQDLQTFTTEIRSVYDAKGEKNLLRDPAKVSVVANHYRSTSKYDEVIQQTSIVTPIPHQSAHSLSSDNSNATTKQTSQISFSHISYEK